MSAAISAAKPPVLGASWDTTSLPVFLTDWLTVSKSQGRIVLNGSGGRAWKDEQDGDENAA